MFTDFNLQQWIIEVLEKKGFNNPTQIQQKVIPLMLQGLDVIGGSETGSGKTLAFGLPALNLITPEEKGVEVLILCPTRELAIQVNDDIRSIADCRPGYKLLPLYGGADFTRQLMGIKKGAKIVVGTPGRVLDHINRRTLKLKNLKLVIFDEADVMLSMGFKKEIDAIISQIKHPVQTCLFSATINSEVKRLSASLLHDPVFIQVGEESSPVRTVAQYYAHVGTKDKKKALILLFKSLKNKQGIVFVNTIKMSQTITNLLNDNNINAKVLNGDMRQAERKGVIANFKSGAFPVLVATDVASRGLDIKGLEFVINYDYPTQDDYYIHRIGRTGRAGRMGEAYTIINNGDQKRKLLELVSSTDTTLEEIKINLTELNSNSTENVPKNFNLKTNKKSSKKLGKNFAKNTSLNHKNKKSTKNSNTSHNNKNYVSKNNKKSSIY